MCNGRRPILAPGHAAVVTAIVGEVRTGADQLWRAVSIRHYSALGARDR
jgi:hypothetical protein